MEQYVPPRAIGGVNEDWRAENREHREKGDGKFNKRLIEEAHRWPQYLAYILLSFRQWSFAFT